MLGYIGEPAWAKLTISRDVAINYCLAEMHFYETWGRHNRRYWKTWQNLAIFVGALTTILAVLPTDSLGAFSGLTGSGLDFWAGVTRAVPAAVTTIAATVLGVYNYKGEHLRQGVTHDALQGELAKFLSKASPYTENSDDQNAGKFVNNIRQIVSSELPTWLKQFTEEQSKNSRPPSEAASDANPVELKES